MPVVDYLDRTALLYRLRKLCERFDEETGIEPDVFEWAQEVNDDEIHFNRRCDMIWLLSSGNWGELEKLLVYVDMKELKELVCEGIEIAEFWIDMDNQNLT